MRGEIHDREIPFIAQGVDQADTLIATFDPAVVKDAFYFNNPVTGTFELLDKALHKRILAGEFRF